VTTTQLVVVDKQFCCPMEFDLADVEDDGANGRVP
jgi:hypothetical protein